MGEVLELANCHVNMKFALVVIYPHDFRISSMALKKALYYQVSL